MEGLVALSIGVMVSCGVYLVLRSSTFPVVLGLTLLSYATNLFLFAMGRLNIGMPAIIRPEANGYADPLPQALVLTAIVIAFGMTAFAIVLALKARGETGSDHVDGRAPDLTLADGTPAAGAISVLAPAPLSGDDTPTEQTEK